MRVTSSSMEALGLTQHRGRGPIPASLTALSLASASPPLGGRATPKLASRSAAQDLDRMGVMTLVGVLGQERRALPSLGSVLGAGGGAQPGSASSRGARGPGVSWVWEGPASCPSYPVPPMSTDFPSPRGGLTWPFQASFCQPWEALHPVCRPETTGGPRG